jgi:DnaJ-class molecular chaperone
MFDEQSRAKVLTTKDYYYILGVRPDATREEIEESYLDMQEKFGPHVSVSGQDPEIMIRTFKDISDAYEVLTDPNKRKEYDKASVGSRSNASELRALWAKRSSTPPPPKAEATPPPPPEPAPASAKPQALAMEMEIEITLKEAMKGTIKQIRLSDPRPCSSCASQKAGSKVQCPTCHGLGYTKTDRMEDVALPAGMYDNMRVTLPERGRFDLRAGRNGDLIIKIRLMRHPFLSVLGMDVTITVPVTVYEAVLGAELDVPTATGKVVMKIQPLTQHGRVYRLKGLGLGGADQLVTIEVLIPQVLSADEAQLYRRLKDLSREPNPRDGLFKH